MSRTRLQQRRAWFQVGFFALFLLAPPLDLFRVDLTLGHAILFGQHWTLGIEDVLAGRTGIGDAALNLFVRGFLPIFGGAALFLFIAWRYGRLYCGWLCPHFSVVETINTLMRRASGKPSIWERRTLPPPLRGPIPQGPPQGARDTAPSVSRLSRRSAPSAASAGPSPSAGVTGDGTDARDRGSKSTASAPYWNRWYWIPTLLAVVGFAFLWALALLTYLLPPFEIYHNLLNGSLTRNQSIFLTAATIAFTVEFLLARHFFCRYVCAVGLFQSLAWMANDRAMVVGFDTRRAAACADCDNACDHACPMRLKPRTIKRKMFTCTECAECISACTQVQHGDSQESLLRWVEGAEALPVVTGRPAATSAGPNENPILPGTCRHAKVGLGARGTTVAFGSMV
ncbi:4Fe-4S binding protein [Thiocapsa sp.]|uniref:4Fe-4S binding protein n=1 Tax=Thiocapsa sp. TaxID=2024551 RepID=UPI00359353E6